jgi:hypothetical protein
VADPGKDHVRSPRTIGGRTPLAKRYASASTNR